MLLVECARRIGSAIREVDTIARIGGDEFVVLCENLTTDSAARERDTREIATRIIKAVDEPFMLTARPPTSRPASASPSRRALRSVPTRCCGMLTSLYEAKQSGGSALAFYDDSMIDRMQYALNWNGKCAGRCRTDELWMAYQPILALDGDNVIGYEALARWNRRPDRA